MVRLYPPGKAAPFVVPLRHLCDTIGVFRSSANFCACSSHNWLWHSDAVSTAHRSEHIHHTRKSMALVFVVFWKRLRTYHFIYPKCSMYHRTPCHCALCWIRVRRWFELENGTSGGEDYPSVKELYYAQKEIGEKHTAVFWDKGWRKIDFAGPKAPSVLLSVSQSRLRFYNILRNNVSVPRLS